jgi:hypothetical protein
MTMKHRTPIRIAIVSLVAACVGCPGSLEDPARFTSEGGGSCPDVPQQVFATVCSTSPGCHATADKTMGLDLQSPNVASRLIGVMAMGGPGLLIDPSDPAMSVMYTKLTASPPFGARMPFGETPLDDATIACVLQWITAQVTDGGAGEGGDDGGVEDGSAEASGDDGSPVEDSSSPPPEDAGMEAAPPPPPPPPVDAGKKPDAGTPVKDAGGGVPDASVQDAGSPPVDAGGD